MIYYTLHALSNGEMGLYLGCVSKLVQISPVLSKNGIKVNSQNAHKMINGKKWSDKVIIVNHSVDDGEALTNRLLSDLKLEGTKQAEAILKQRKQKRK